MPNNLRDYQARALNELRAAFLKLKSEDKPLRLMLMMATGGGKTRIAAEIVNGARGKAKKVLFTVPAISLIDQTVEMFAMEGIRNVGVIQANHHMTDWSQPIQIASIQTLMKREIPECDIVIRDEAHKLYKFDLYWMAQPEWAHIPFIGLSATPWTTGLGRYYSELLIGATTGDLIKQGYLVPIRTFAPSHPDLSQVRIQMGDYHEVDLSKVMSENALTADIVETWLRLAENRPTIVFAVDCEHAKKLQQRFTDAGVPTGYMDASWSLTDRASTRRAFRNGTLRVICNVDVMGIGCDWPEISCISYCRPTRSEMRFVQNVGRGLRPSPGKKDLLLLDHSDTSLRLGFVTDIHHETLSMGKEKLAKRGVSPERLPKECPKCGYLSYKASQGCSNCGHIPEKHTNAIEGNGELVEFRGLKRGREGKKHIWTIPEKKAFYSELLAYAIQKGYKNGWADHKYQEKFEVWPRLGPVVPAKKISDGTRDWLRRQQARWFIRKQMAENRHEGNGNQSNAAGSTVEWPRS